MAAAAAAAAAASIEDERRINFCCSAALPLPRRKIVENDHPFLNSRMQTVLKTQARFRGIKISILEVYDLKKSKQLAQKIYAKFKISVFFE